MVMLFVGECTAAITIPATTTLTHGDADHGGPSVFSARIMAAFLTAFGVGGVVGRYYDLSHPAASGVGVVAGIVMAGLVYQFAKLLLFAAGVERDADASTLVGTLRRSLGGHSRRRRRPGVADASAASAPSTSRARPAARRCRGAPRSSSRDCVGIRLW